MEAEKIVKQLLEGAVNDKLSPYERQKINAAFNDAGLGGSKAFGTVGAGINVATAVLARFGIEPADIFQTFGSKGRETIDLARTNNDDPFSPLALRNTMLVFSWHPFESGNYEVTAYVS